MTQQRKILIGIAVCVSLATLIYFSTRSSFACIEAPILNAGAKPQTEFTYNFVGAHPTDSELCIVNAFTAWQTALQESTQLTFRRAKAGEKTNITIIFTPIRDNIAGATTSTTRDAQGYVTGFGILISTNVDLVSSCQGYYKVALHEIGHGLGLGHPFGTNGTSVMNMLSSMNDANGNVPFAPTFCDIGQVAEASSTPLRVE